MDSAALECRTFPIYFRHHHLEVRRQVEEFFTVTSPIGVLSPGGRNLPEGYPDEGRRLRTLRTDPFRPTCKRPSAHSGGTLLRALRPHSR